MSKGQQAQLWRMNMGDHICPYGIKAKDLLERNGFQVEDHHLKTRAEVDEFKAKHEVKTTPQVWIDDQRIGGYDALREHLGETPKDQDAPNYRPVIAIFAVAAAAAGAIQLANGALFSWQTLIYFIALSMTILATQKLQDLEAFSLQFVTYDLLAMRHVRYAYIYPFAEAYTGIGMLSGLSPWLFAPVGIFIGALGGFSVFKAVYLDKRELKCACVGGNSNVPLGFVSLTENLFMIGAGLAMLVASL